MTQQNLPLAEAARDTALARVQLANEDWVDHAVETVRWLAKQGQPFTTDDVWAHVTYRPAEPRAMGAAMRVASSIGIARATGRYVKSKRVACHARPVMVWERA